MNLTRKFSVFLKSFGQSALYYARENVHTNAPRKVVFISQSSEIFSNLALENWLYNNMTFCNKEVLFLWSNEPCVVIGRHQNPYVESNLPYIENAAIPVVRRKSGGGTVYHDRGNLNCTFFSSRERYNRKWNLKIISKALKDDFNITSTIDCKDNIMIDGSYKVSGTAAKLGRLSAYHHCTLLVDSDEKQLKLALRGDKSIVSNATASIPASVKNLKNLNDSLTVERLLASVGRMYLQSMLDNDESSSDNNYQSSSGFTLVNPTNDWFPGLDNIKAELESWNWLYGMTPKFTITRPVEVPSTFGLPFINVSIQTYHGIIKNVKVEADIDAPTNLIDMIENFVGEGLKGSRYYSDIFSEISVRLRLPVHLASQNSE